MSTIRARQSQSQGRGRGRGRRRRRGFGVGVGLLFVCAACESGTSISVDVTLAPDATAPFSAERPGIVRIDTAAIATTNVTALCGNELSEIQAFDDLGFGCLDDALANTDEELIGWIEPLPVDQGYDAAAVCASALDDGPDDIVVTVPEGAEPLPDAPDDGDAQGTGTMSWRRDFSPCGGRGTGAVTISALIGG